MNTFRGCLFSQKLKHLRERWNYQRWDCDNFTGCAKRFLSSQHYCVSCPNKLSEYLEVKQKFCVGGYLRYQNLLSRTIARVIWICTYPGLSSLPSTDISDDSAPACLIMKSSTYSKQVNTINPQCKSTISRAFYAHVRRHSTSKTAESEDLVYIVLHSECYNFYQS